MKVLQKYDVLIFDLDGLIIDSLDNLSNSLVGAVSKFGNREQVQAFQVYDQANPGFSRFEKIDYFARTILQDLNFDQKVILREFDTQSYIARVNSPLSPYIHKLKEAFKEKIWVLLTNCDVSQIGKVSKELDLVRIFGDNLVGTPPSKNLRAAELRAKYSNHKVLSISDSESDGIIALENKFDFLFIEEYSRGDAGWSIDNYLKVNSLQDLL